MERNETGLELKNNLAPSRSTRSLGTRRRAQGLLVAAAARAIGNGRLRNENQRAGYGRNEREHHDDGNQKLFHGSNPLVLAATMPRLCLVSCDGEHSFGV